MYLKNAWYCAAWANEVTRSPILRTLLGEPVVMYRKEDGGIIALNNICPHRYAPLNEGVVHGDRLACPYHGLQFEEGGACVVNPHGPIIPPQTKVKGYCVAEKHLFAWIWMGDETEADPDKIPDLWFHDDPGYVTVGGLVPVPGNYQLVTDNLLDLSHTQFLHPVLTSEADDEGSIVQDVSQEGEIIVTVFDLVRTKPIGFARLCWPDAPERINLDSGITWRAPANMVLKVHLSRCESEAADKHLMWSANLVTPETATTCHYFWSFARNFRNDNQNFSDELQQTVGTIFTNEDGAMIAKVQKAMKDETDLLALRPVILPTDSAAVRARHALRKRINAEKSAAGESAAIASDRDQVTK